MDEEARVRIAFLIVALIFCVPRSQAETRLFSIGGTEIELARQTNAQVFFRSMRLNRAQGVWNVDAYARNGGTEMVRSPIVLRIEQSTNGSLITPFFTDADGKAFLELRETGSGLAPGAEFFVGTLALQKTDQAPALIASIFSRLEEITGAVAATRALDENGIPLAGVVAGVARSGPGGWMTIPIAETNVIRFDAPGRVSVFRESPVGAGVLEIPTPRLTRRSGVSTNLGGVVARITWLTPQTLIAPLPLGWSPAASCVVEFEGEPQGAVLSLSPFELIAPGQNLPIVHFDETRGLWIVTAFTVGDGLNSIFVPVAKSGAYAVVVGDLGVPATALGAVLSGVSTPLPDFAMIRAIGKVDPTVASPSRILERVTARAEVIFQSTNDPLSSGTIFHGVVREEYKMRDGSRRVPPSYETTITGYRELSGGSTHELVARFPLRPLLLLSGEELSEARVTVDVFGPRPAPGEILTSSGGQISAGGIRLFSGLEDFDRPVVAAARDRTLSDLAFVATNEIVAAFELDVDALPSGKFLKPIFETFPTNAELVLARVVFTEGLYGLQPVQRFHSSADGQIQSLEPDSGDRLPGVNDAGLYVLLHVDASRGVISGVARNSNHEPASGLPVRIEGEPWLAISGDGGTFQLLAPAGTARLTVEDPTTDANGARLIDVPGISGVANADLETTLAGPRIVRVSPEPGASNVPAVTSIVIDFDKPLNPASLGTNGIVLRDAAAVVAAGVSLNLRGTSVTLLPLNPLASDQIHSIEISPDLTDLGGRKLEGTNHFTFTTESDRLNRGAAQLILFEPNGGQSPVVGTPGSAEPEAPVILINETTGFTATVLSKVDGSFSNTIPAEVDDVLSAVLVNQNGTRLTLPASRQIFRDGSVGLFQGGGSIVVSNEVGELELVIAPGAVPKKTRFFAERITPTNLLAVAGNVQPEGGQVVAAIRYKTEGDPLRAPAKVKVTVDPSTLGLPAGTAPEEANFMLTVPHVVDGVMVYEVIDKMTFKEGHLSTASPPFPGLGFSDGIALAMIKAVNGGRVPVAGKVLSLVRDANGVADHSSERPVRGAVVFINEPGIDLSGNNGRVASGALVSVADENGSFALMARGQTLNSGETSFSLLATSPLFPGQFGTGLAVTPPDTDVASASGRVFFTRNAPTLTLGGPDLFPPTLSVTHAPFNPAVSTTTRLRVLASDDRQIKSVSVKIQSVEGTDGSLAVGLTNVTLQGPLNGQQTQQTFRQEFDLTASLPLRALLQISALDNESNLRTMTYPVEFGGAGAVLFNPTPDTNDTHSPFVVSSSPLIGSDTHAPGAPITITFNEPIDPGFQANLDRAFILEPPAGRPTVQISEDKRTVSLSYYALQPGTAYYLTVTAMIEDINGNGLDQNPNNNITFESFGLPFKTLALPSTRLPGIESGGGVVSMGGVLFVLDRAGGGSLAAFDVSDPGQPVLISRLPLDSFPRDIVAVPNFSFKPTQTAPIETENVVVVTGGATGGEGQWIMVVDVSKPELLRRLASAFVTRSVSAAVTKLAWSPPVIGYLESDADVTSVGLINLQLFIYANHLPDGALSGEPAGGLAGVDINGDGDFVDPGELLPRLDSTRPRNGLINAGLVASHTLANETSQRILDFSSGFGGRFLGVVMGAGRALDDKGVPSGPELSPQYLTLLAGGVRLDLSKARVEMPAEPKRVTTLFGVPLKTPEGLRPANLALVSLPPSANQTSGTLRVIDVTDPLAPAVLTDISIPSRHGIPQSVIQRADGVLMLATSRDVLLLDASLLGLPAPAAPQTHPAITGFIPGAGSGVRSFVGTSEPFFAVASGGDSRIVGLPGSINLTLHRPGTVVSPGPVVPEESEDKNDETLVFVNDDVDGVPFGPDFGLPRKKDYERNPLAVTDNDLVKLKISRVRPLIGQKILKTAELRIICPEANSNVVRVADAFGVSVPFTGTNGNTVFIRDTLGSTFGFLSALREEDLFLFLDATNPVRNVKVEFEVFDENGISAGKDVVKFSAIRAKVTAIWSEQFPGSRSNQLPGNTGENEVIIMGNDKEGITRVGATVELFPDLPQFRQRLLARLFIPFERRVIGQSVWTKSDVSVTAREDRIFGFPPFPLKTLLFSSMLGSHLHVEEVLAVGLDYDGNGELSEPELATGFEISSREGRLNVSESTEFDFARGLLEPHFKVIPEAFFLSQISLAIPLLIGADVNQPLALSSAAVELFGQAFGVDLVPEFIDDAEQNSVIMPMATTRLFCFLTGSPQVGAPILWPDLVDAYDFPDELHAPPGHQIMNHQTGKFVDGFRKMPRLHYNASHYFSRKLSRSPQFNETIFGNIAVNEEVKAAIRGALTPSGTFETRLTLVRAATANEEDRNRMGFNFSSKEIDLSYALGNAAMPEAELELKGERKNLPDGRPGVIVTSAKYRVIVEDIYDWDYGINPFGVVLQAGFGAYSSVVGQNFVNHFTVEGELSGELIPVPVGI
jgi:hypothetical protein